MITFTLSTHILELPDVERLPASRPVRMRQTLLETDSGAVVVYGIGNPAIDLFTMELYPLSAALAQEINMDFHSDKCGTF